MIRREWLTAGSFTVNAKAAARWSGPVVYVLDRFHEDYDAYRLDNPHLFRSGALPPREVYQAWAVQNGINPFSRGLEEIVHQELGRRKPCRICGVKTRDRIDPYRCDRCLDAVVIERERERDRRAFAAARRRAGLRLMANLPAGRRQMVELCGGPVTSPEQVYFEAYGEAA